MSSLKPNTAGVYDIPSANIDTLYIKGKKFQDYINELVFEDQLEQSEITEIKLLLEYLDTTGLNSAWTVTNSNVNETLRSAIIALQNKLAQIDTTALSQSSVLTNDNRNSVLKSRLDTAEGDIDNVENKTRFITEASITGTGNNTVSTYTTLVGPTTEQNGSTAIKLNVKNAGSDLVGYEIKSNFNNSDYALNESTYSHNDGRLTLAAETVRIQATDQCRIGTFKDRDAFSEMDIKIGGQGNKINIASIDDQNPTGPLTQVWIGRLGGTTTRSTEVSLEGNIYVGNARFPQLDKTDKFTFTQLGAFIKTVGIPAWVVSFALTSAIPNFEYSDCWVMKDGGFGSNKKGDVATSNNPKLNSLVVFNSSVNVARLTPVEGTFVGSGTISKTTLNGSIRNSVFLDGGGDNKICFKHHNISASDITDWAVSEANDMVNVIEIGGNSGILVHQGASSTGTPLQIINSCNGSIKMSLDNDGTKGSAKPALEVMPYDNTGTFQTMTRIGFYPGLNQGTGKVGSYQLEVNQELDRDGIAVATTNITTGVTVVNKINANSINTPGTITGVDVVGTTSISAPTATATSLVINGNYTGNTDARLYKNADNKLMWNGAEVGAGGVSSGGITYMINVPSNITNPHPTPSETTMTAAYSGNAQRTITQAVSANTAFYIAKYTTEVFDELTNPVLTGLQQLNQYVVWNSQNQVGQLYGRLWFQATAAGSATLYQRTYASPVTTTAAQLINGTPIQTPKGLYNIAFQRVVFPNINVVVSNGPVVLRFRVEGLVSGSWTTLATMAGGAPEFLTTTANINVLLNESIDLNQTTAGATALRLVLFINSGTGTISQTSAGGADLGAYSLIGIGANTPALFRTMLYDGTNAKITVPYSTTPTLIEYDLAIDAPYNVSAFPTPTLSTDLYFIQPSGGFANHAITLYFNEGTISHYHSTISPTQTIPTLAQVLNSGATASQAINMNTNKISGITALEGASNGNWNVKEITAGTNISVSPTNGSYQIVNTAPTQDVAAGTGIQIAKNGSTATITNTGVLGISAGTGISVSTTNGVATITNTAATHDVAAGTGIQIAKNGTTATVINNAEVQKLTASAGISISIDTPTRNATITNTGVLGISAGTGISVSTTNGVATISNSATAGGQAARDQLSATSSVGLVPNKLSHYAQNWTTQSVSVQPEDIFVSHDGRNCVYIPGSGNSFVQYSFDYGITWTNSNLQTGGFLYICGSTTGEVLYISRNGGTTGSAPNVVYTSNIYVSYNYGVFWSELTLDRTPGAANTWYNRFIRHIRCSTDGSVVIASTFRTTTVSGVPNDGTLYISTNGGSTWVVRNITAGPAQVADCCMSANGAIMFATMNGVLGGTTDNGNGGIYRSFDYGATWTKVRNQIQVGSYFFGVIKCDATGRFLVACDESQTDPPGGQIQTSDDYGSGWTWFGDEQARAGTAAYVSPGGNLMITAHDPAFSSRIRYSTDYGRNWINAISLNTILGAATIRTLASNNDGSVILIRSNNAAAVYRCIEERGKLELAATSRDLTITPAFGGGYTLLSTPTETLWFSGGFEIQTGNPQSKIDFDFLSAGKIDLTQFNIRYEIECYWSTGTWSYIYPLLAINDVRNIDLGVNENGLAYDPLSGLTNWTNHINNGVYGGAEEYNQTYRNRFFCGYFPGSTTNNSAPANDQIRQKSLMRGTLSLHRRPTGQTGITDASPNSRDILNIFTCDNYATRFYSGMSYLLNSSVQQGTDYGVNHQRINGTGIFPAEPVWSYNAIANSPISLGVQRLGLHLSEGGTTTLLRPRAAHFVYRIYRVRK